MAFNAHGNKDFELAREYCQKTLAFGAERVGQENVDIATNILAQLKDMPAAKGSAPKVEPMPVKSPPLPVGTTRDGHLLSRSATLGGPGGTEFEDLPAARAILVGLNVTGGLSGKAPIVLSLQPIYLKPDGKKSTGETIGTPKGKVYTLGDVPEFAIASVNINASNQGVHGLQAHLRRLEGHEFALNNLLSKKQFSADTPWVGKTGISVPSTVAGGAD